MGVKSLSLSLLASTPFLTCFQLFLSLRSLMWRTSDTAGGGYTNMLKELTVRTHLSTWYINCSAFGYMCVCGRCSKTRIREWRASKNLKFNFKFLLSSNIYIYEYVWHEIMYVLWIAEQTEHQVRQKRPKKAQRVYNEITTVSWKRWSKQLSSAICINRYPEQGKVPAACPNAHKILAVRYCVCVSERMRACARV